MCMLDDDPIPLEECSGSPFVSPNPPTEKASPSPSGAAIGVRLQRKQSRRSCTNTRVCFIPEFDSGKVDPTECPVIDMSAGGFSIEYDRRVANGQRGTIAYRSDSGLPVHVGCIVRHCVEQMDGLFRLGIKLDRKLRPGEMHPIRAAIGRELAPGIRARKLKRAFTGFGDPA